MNYYNNLIHVAYNQASVSNWKPKSLQNETNPNLLLAARTCHYLAKLESEQGNPFFLLTNKMLNNTLKFEASHFLQTLKQSKTITLMRKGRRSQPSVYKYTDNLEPITPTNQDEKQEKIAPKAKSSVNKTRKFRIQLDSTNIQKLNSAIKSSGLQKTEFLTRLLLGQESLTKTNATIVDLRHKTETIKEPSATETTTPKTESVASNVVDKILYKIGTPILSRKPSLNQETLLNLHALACNPQGMTAAQVADWLGNKGIRTHSNGLDEVFNTGFSYISWNPKNNELVFTITKNGQLLTQQFERTINDMIDTGLFSAKDPINHNIEVVSAN
jgi:hypothetical protein